MGWATLDGKAPQIIAHRGSSGLYPEHVLPGYQQGLEDGAEIIEPDLVPSRDGVLFCRHDLELARSTDIEQHEALRDRRSGGDWLITDLLAAEIDTLHCRQPFAGRTLEFDGHFNVPRFTSMIDWAAAQAQRRAQEVWLYPEIKHPQRLREQGMDPVPTFISLAQQLPPGVRILVQCFDAEALRRVRAATGLPCALLIDSRGDPEQALREHGAWLAGLALSKKFLGGKRGGERIARIHQQGLRVDGWTFRDDAPGPGFAGIADELRWAMQLGVDRLFCDYPATACRVRSELSASMG